jgi:hypothetical protein
VPQLWSPSSLPANRTTRQKGRSGLTWFPVGHDLDDISALRRHNSSTATEPAEMNMTEGNKNPQGHRKTRQAALSSAST